MVTSGALRVVFFGTPAFAVPTLDALLASRHPVVAVVTQPDKPRGRGHKFTDAPVKARALSAALPVLQPASMKDSSFLAALAALNADIGVVAAYGKILTEAVLSTPKIGLVNVHASLLPRHRGAAPIARAIIAGDRETGITIMRVVKALDAGPMLAESRRTIGPEETSDAVERDLARMGASLLVSTLDRIASGESRETPQDDSRATYAPRLAREDGLIDWSRTNQEIHNLVRGLHPWPHAYTFLHGDRLIVHRTKPVAMDASGDAGQVLQATGDGFCVASGRGAIELVEVQAEGKRPMSARDFLAGHAIRPGEQLTRQP